MPLRPLTRLERRTLFTALLRRGSRARLGALMLLGALALLAGLPLLGALSRIASVVGVREIPEGGETQNRCDHCGLRSSRHV